MTDKNFGIIELINISKRFNGKAILSKINLTIYRGETIGITGPIGAGKTSLIQLTLGLLTPDDGQIKIFGKEFEKHRQIILEQINSASSSLRLNGYSSVMENLLTFAQLYNVRHPHVVIQKLARDLHITRLLDSGSKVYKLSAGESSTVNLCKSLLNDPKIVFFDEITAHMDPTGVDRFNFLINKRESENKTTILISQNIPELIQVCDRVIFMENGKISRIYPKTQFKKLTHIYDR